MYSERGVRPVNVIATPKILGRIVGAITVNARYSEEKYGDLLTAAWSLLNGALGLY